MNARLFALGAWAAIAIAACGGDDNGGPGGVDASPEGAATDASTADGAMPAADAGPSIVDRMGRPGITTVLVGSALKDAYNHEAPFTPSTAYQGTFEAHLESLDTLALDGTNPDPVDWPLANGVHPLRDPLLTDVLLVDPTKPCSANGSFSTSYLALESELLLGGPAHATCGGRTPNDDVVDTTLTLLVVGTRAGAPKVSDGVSAATKPATLAFPYLAAPN